jgi:hypothetical protein
VKDDSIREVIPIGLTPYDEAVMAALVEGAWRRLEPGKVAGIVPEVANEAFALGHGLRRPGVVLEAHSLVVEATPGDVWRQVEGIGGEAGWYYVDWAWTLRGWIDRLIGGVGNRRQRPTTVKPGDDLDTWRVERIDDGRDLVLRSQMRMPKRAIWDFTSGRTPGGGAGAVGGVPPQRVHVDVLVGGVPDSSSVFADWSGHRPAGRRTRQGGPVHVHS